jgi:hypothetical protein
MEVTLVEPARIEREWPFYAEMLWPAVRQDPAKLAMAELRRRFQEKSAFLVGGEIDGARGYLAYQLFEQDGDPCCFASYLVGTVEGGPRKMIRTMRLLMSAFEGSCRSEGIKQVYIGGRDWGRVFPDYELTGDVPNRRRKRL